MRARPSSIPKFGKGFTACIAIVSCPAIVATLTIIWVYTGTYGLYVLARNGGTYWISVAEDSPRLSPSMRLALASSPIAKPGDFRWRRIAEGFEVGDLPAVAEGKVVDRFFLARIDPARFHFVVRNAFDGDRDLDDWMAKLKPALVFNGSYFARDGKPDVRC